MTERALLRLNPWASPLLRRGARTVFGREGRMALRLARRAACLERIALGRNAVADWAAEMRELRPTNDRLTRIWMKLARLDASDAEFDATLDFGAVALPSNLDLSGSRLRGAVHFENMSCAALLLRGAAFRGPLTLSGARVAENLDGVGVQFDERVDATRLFCGGKAAFNRAIWTSDTWFRDARFARCVYFDDARFIGEASFLRADFRSGASFVDARFESGVSFEAALFVKDADFLRTSFAGPVHLRGVDFGEPLEQAAFAGSVARSSGRFRPRLVVDEKEPTAAPDRLV